MYLKCRELIDAVSEILYVCVSKLKPTMSGSTLAESGHIDNVSEVRQLCANGSWMKTSVVEEKLDEGNIHEAESALREGLSLNFEV